jgi:hypothetical protein
MGQGAYEGMSNYAKLLTRGSQSAVPIASGASSILDIDCAGDSELTLEVDMTGAAVGDLGLGVFPFEGTDNVTPLPNAAIPAIRSSGVVFSGATVDYTGTYDVSGVAKVRVVVKNNNAGPQTLNRLSWRLS